MDVSRRQFLGGGAALLGAGGLLKSTEYWDVDDDGIDLFTEYGVRDDLDAYLQDTYRTPVEKVTNPGEVDLLLELRRVGDADISDEARETIEDLYADHGIYLTTLKHPETFDAEIFEQRYGNDAKNVLWGEDSFYEDTVTDPAARRYIMQAFVVPYDTINSHCAGQRNDDMTGYDTWNRFILTDDAGEITLGHELGHATGLPHNDEDNYTGLMQTEFDGEIDVNYSRQEWETIRKRLPTMMMFRVPAPGHDLVCSQGPDSVIDWATSR